MITNYKLPSTAWGSIQGSCSFPFPGAPYSTSTTLVTSEIRDIWRNWRTDSVLPGSKNFAETEDCSPVWRENVRRLHAHPTLKKECLVFVTAYWKNYSQKNHFYGKCCHNISNNITIYIFTHILYIFIYLDIYRYYTYNLKIYYIYIF